MLFLPWHEVFLHAHVLRVIQFETAVAFQFPIPSSSIHWITVYIDCWLFQDLQLLHPMSIHEIYISTFTCKGEGEGEDE